MPRALAVDVDLFSRGGLAILDRIEAQGYDVLTVAAEAGQAREARPARPRRPGAARPRRPGPVDGPGRTRGGSERVMNADLARELSPSARRSRGARRGTSTRASCSCPADRRRSMCALYAFMRQTDDLADEPGARSTKRRGARRPGGATSTRALGRPRPTPGPACPRWPTRSHRHAIPARYLHEVIDGVAMDLEPAAVRDVRRPVRATATASPRPSASAACTSGAFARTAAGPRRWPRRAGSPCS